MNLEPHKVYYTAYFCEENVWQYANANLTDYLEEFNVLYLTNSMRSIALRNQKEAKPNQFVCWDYHVILHNFTRGIVYDFDTRLGFKTLESYYTSNTFPNSNFIPEEFQTWVRAIPLKTYLRYFHSDRSHMLNEKNQARKPFPHWPLICPSEKPLRHSELLDFGFSKPTPFVIWEEYFNKKALT